MKSIVFNFFLYWIILSCSSSAHSQPGTLDSAFGNNGKVTTDLGRLDVCNSLAIQSDGKILAGGWSGDSILVFALVRYNSNGSIDSSFGMNGTATTNIIGQSLGITLQQDGKILMAGAAGVDSRTFAVARLASDGSLDSNFGTNGMIIDPRLVGEARCVTQAKDNKIIVAGYAMYSSTISRWAFTVARYNENGSIDSSFGMNGIATTIFGSFGDLGSAMAFQQNGEIVLGGICQIDSNRTSILEPGTAEFTSDGNLDSSYGINGRTAINVPTYAYGPFASLVIQSDGKILISNTAYNGTYNTFNLIRYSSNGILDSSFGQNGIVYLDLGSDSYCSSLAIDSGNNIYAAGSNYNGVTWKPILARINLNGTLDTSFGYNGSITISFTKYYDYCGAISLQPDGKLILAGVAAFDSLGDFALARINTTIGQLPCTEAVSNELTKNITSTSAKLLWGQSQGVLGYQVIYKSANSSPKAMGTKDTSITITGLAPSTNYVWVVKAKCTSGFSPLSNRQFFKTTSVTASAPFSNVFKTQSQISIYPNPTKDLLTIKGLDAHDESTFVIIDAIGRVFFKQRVVTSPFTCNIKSLTDGTYFIKIISRNSYKTLKIIKE